MASKQESVWILRAQCGDRDAFELVLRRVQPSLRGYLVGLVGPSDADDVLQEVLLQIYRKLTWLENPALFRPGGFRIACRAGSTGPLNKPHQGASRGHSHQGRLRYELAASAPHHPRSSREELRVKGEGEKAILIRD